ncbi:hypothetical protein FQG23_01830 [Escherichia coli]|nr:hypothetical protein [Escherichia coli]EFN5007982.1 hypothetical protein [Escherichia coli]
MKTNIYFAFPFVLFLLTFNIIIINLVDALMANSSWVFNKLHSVIVITFLFRVNRGHFFVNFDY